MKPLPDLSLNLPNIAAGRRILQNVLRRRDVPEPVTAWRSAPEAALVALTPEHKLAYVEALLPLVHNGRKEWIQFFEKLTDIENRVAASLGKKGHIVRVDDRKLEIFKKAVAAVGVPGAVLFPLGTIGLSVEGITSGLVALGGGFLLPASVAMVTGLGVAVTLGVTSKKVLDLVLPTTDADRASIDLERLNHDAAEILKTLDQATTGDPEKGKVEEARAKISEIIRRIVPLSDAERERIEDQFKHARILGDRYLAYLEHDRDALESRNHVGADEVASLLQLDTPAIR